MKKKHIGVVATICTIICVAIFIPKLWNNAFDSTNKSNEQISQEDKSYATEIIRPNSIKNEYSEEKEQPKEDNNELKKNLDSKIQIESKEEKESKIQSDSDIKGDKDNANTQNDLDNNQVKKNNSELVTNSKESKDTDKKSIIQEEKLQDDRDTIIENDKKEIIKFTLIVSKEQKGYVGQEAIIFENKEINIEDGKSAMNYLKDNIENVEDKGGFINKILGIESKYPIPKSELTEEQKEKDILGIDWFIYLNGEKTKVGANDIYLKEGDILNFDYHQWDKREFKQ